MKKYINKIGKAISNSSNNSSKGGKGTNRNAYFAEQAEKSAKRLPNIAKLIIAFFFIAGAIASFFVCKLICKNDCFEINGKKSYSISVNTTYVDEGVTVIGFGQDLTAKVNVKIYKDSKEISGFNEIDTTQECVYQIVYTVDSFRFKDVQLIRTVTVVSDITEDYEGEEDSYTPEEDSSTKTIFQINQTQFYI